MGLINTLRARAVCWLAGDQLELDKEVERIYDGIWPKHEFYNASNRRHIKEGLVRATAQYAVTQETKDAQEAVLS